VDYSQVKIYFKEKFGFVIYLLLLSFIYIIYTFSDVQDAFTWVSFFKRESDF